MASPLDLQEQEQLDELKAFWRQYGNFVTWTLALALAVVAGYNGWNLWQRNQAEGAAVLFDQMQKAATGKDAGRATTVFNDIKDRYGRTTYAANAGLVAAKVQAAAGQTDEALKTLAWIVDSSGDAEVKVMSRLHAAGLLMDKKLYDDALKQLDALGPLDGTFAALAADRRGDVLAAQGKSGEARTSYEAALKLIDDKLDYRQLIDAKLAAMGASTAPVVAAAAPTASTPSSTATASGVKP